jgi:hypothetical protein
MELKDWLNSINQTKKHLIDEDPSIEKAKQALKILTKEQLKFIKSKFDTGGKA